MLVMLEKQVLRERSEVSKEKVVPGSVTGEGESKGDW